jgi:hypothetical protein
VPFSSDVISGSFLNSDLGYVLTKMRTALPWLIPGCVVSLVLAAQLGGDVRRTGWKDRILDGIYLGILLGVATTLATFLQGSLEGDPNAKSMFASGLSGVACGAVIGLLVPGAFRADVVRPFDDEQIKRLDDLKNEAISKLGLSADDWLYKPHKALRGITPAEALQHQNIATGVSRLLNELHSRLAEDGQPDAGERIMPTVIEGGRRAGVVGP